jgi:hypothetical protein
MAISRKYFHDHYILLLASINLFLFLVVVVFIVVRLSSGHSTSYIVECRDCSNPDALNKFMTGGVTELIGFIVFSLIVLVTNISLSIKSYSIHRQLAISMLGLGILLQVLTLTVSNALLVLR